MPSEMRRAGAVVLVWGSASAGCTPSYIAPQYASYSGCPEEKIDVEEMDIGEKYRASGCGNTVTFHCVNMERCVSPEIIVARRHAKQFSCSPQDAAVESLGGDGYIAIGCGQRMTYQCFPDPRHAMRCFAETAEVESRR